MSTDTESAEEITTTRVPIHTEPRRVATVLLGLQAIETLIGLPEGLRAVGVSDYGPGLGVNILVEGEALHPVPEACYPSTLHGSWQAEYITVEGKTYRRIEWEQS